MENTENKESEVQVLKKTNEEYIREMEKFLDTASNIEDEDLQERVIFQMLKCDKILTEMTEKLCKKYHTNQV